MRIMPRKIVLITAIAALGGLASALLRGASSRERAEPVPYLIGTWSGYVQFPRGSEVEVPDALRAELLIDQQRRRHFSGRLERALIAGWWNGQDFAIGGTATPASFPVFQPPPFAITDTADGQHVVFQGKGSDGEIRGRVRAQALLYDFGLGGAILDGGLNEQRQAYAPMEGSLLLLRPFAGEPSGLADGHWMGETASDVTGEHSPLATELVSDEIGTTFMGRLSYEPRGVGVDWMPLLGTFNSADQTTLMICVAIDAQLLIQARHTDETDLPAAIDGRYLVRLADGTEDTGKLHIESLHRIEPK